MAKVLIVDDANFMRMMIKNMLKDKHEVVGEGTNGLEGLELYKKLKPDVVTMDITMDVMTGIEAVKEIKKFDPEAKIIMCSAMGQQYLVIDAIQAGATDFVVKPFTPETILSAIEKVLNK